MSFLDGLFTRTVNDSLEVYDEQIAGDTTISPGYLYQYEGSDDDVTLTLETLALAAVAGKRFAVKVFTPADTPPGGTLTIAVPGGMSIEDDDGEQVQEVTLEGDQIEGNYREWLCDDAGHWMMVVGAAGGGAVAVPPASTYENGGAQELSLVGMSGMLADVQKTTIAKNGTDVANRVSLNLIEGLGIKLTVADNTVPAVDRVDATIAEQALATGFAWSANAATIDVSAAKNFAATNTLTGNSTLTLSNGADGMNGVIHVKQDGTGSRTLAFTIAGRTVLKDLNVADTNPLVTANSITEYHYYFVTIAGTAYCRIFKVFLQ